MEYNKIASNTPHIPSAQEVALKVEAAKKRVNQNLTDDVYRSCFGSIDLTSLSSTDSDTKIEEFTHKVVDFAKHYSGVKNVASVCLYPNFVETAGLVIGNSAITLGCVAGGFPSSQTFIEVKILEAAMAVEQGADEVDFVISLGELLEGRFEMVSGELEMLRQEIGQDVVMKVILEAGKIDSTDTLFKGALAAMAAGADFIKTSTGKDGSVATPEAAVVMCEAIKEYFRQTGRRVGFKASGGITTVQDAALYYTIVEDILGSDWLSPSFFRLGASSLANNLLGAITGKEENYF